MKVHIIIAGALTLVAILIVFSGQFSAAIAIVYRLDGWTGNIVV
jgi:hypothetical protein